ncbi:unnamed protein product [Prorocentrum cordatum]|uniref:Uncharacterized protein n=1 Tax=Prorocentrum cordatum TaxID=2364126 RepID=A0ABN9UHK9_9DINO|nr:unnamed protein product [Polarella glacialis]
MGQAHSACRAEGPRSSDDVWQPVTLAPERTPTGDAAAAASPLGSAPNRPGSIGCGTAPHLEPEPLEARSPSASSRAPPPGPGIDGHVPLPGERFGAWPPSRMAEIPEEDDWSTPDHVLPEVPPLRPLPAAAGMPAASEEDRRRTPPTPRPSIDSDASSGSSVDSRPSLESGGQIYFGRLRSDGGGSGDLSPRPPSARAQRMHPLGGWVSGLDLEKLGPNLLQSTGRLGAGARGGYGLQTMPVGTAWHRAAPPLVERGDSDDFDAKVATIKALFQQQEQRQREALRQQARLVEEQVSSRPSIEWVGSGPDGRSTVPEESSEELDAVSAAQRWESEREKREVVAAFLKQHGFSGPNARRTTSKQSDFPLHVAAERGDDRAVALLLEMGADPAARNSAGRSPAEVALQKNRGGSHAGVLRVLAEPPPSDKARRRKRRLFGSFGRSRGSREPPPGAC